MTIHLSVLMNLFKDGVVPVQKNVPNVQKLSGCFFSMVFTNGDFVSYITISN